MSGASGSERACVRQHHAQRVGRGIGLVPKTIVLRLVLADTVAIRQKPLHEYALAWPILLKKLALAQRADNVN